MDFEQLNEIVITELSITGKNVLENFQFHSPYTMRPQGDCENGLNLDDEHIPYNQLSSV